MSYTFSSFVTIPGPMIREIGGDLLKKMMENVVAVLPELDDNQLSAIEHQGYFAIMDLVSRKSEGQDLTSVDGFRLRHAQVLEIAEYLDGNRFVDSVRAFRDYTGCGLREAKAFVERFGTGQTASRKFIDTFQQQ